MSYQKAAKTTAVPAGKMTIVTLGETDILIANINGSFYAVNNRCPHLGGSLGKGVLAGSTVTCPRHGAQFDVTSGAARHDAKIAFITMKVSNLKTYPVKVEGDDILVDLT